MGGTRRRGDGGGGCGRGGEVAEEEVDGAGVASAEVCGHQVRRVRALPALARAGGASGNSGIGVAVGGGVLPGGVAVRVWRPLLLAVTPSANLTTSATPPAVRLFTGGRRGT